jgi:adenine-specific DNA-methyltransferase
MPFLQFKGRTAVECYHHTISHHTLEFDSNLSVLGKGENPGLDGNLIIEGDNLLGLKALLPTHANKIKCIYIDPPYNTGEEGWVYNDNLNQPQFKDWFGKTVGKEGEDACRHDKWCCMMYPRLQLLKDLLRDDGAIFISIDDHEVQNLRALMDDIFGDNNFVATVIWEKVYSPKSSAKYLSENHDYILIYARNKKNWKRRLLPRTEEANARYTNDDDDPRGPWKSSDLSARNYYSKGTYSIECPGGRRIDGPPEGRYWSVEEDVLWELDEDKRIWWGANQNNEPALKRFLAEVKDLVPETIWTYQEVGHTQAAKKEVLRVLSGVDAVLTPKPVDLLRRICWIASEPGDIILDSFAGSGTTAHAVLEMNAEDKGERKFIIIQQPYDSKSEEHSKFNICQNVTQKRVSKVVSGYDYVKRGPKGKRTEVHQPGLGGAFSYARLGKPLFNDYRDLGDQLPSFEELAKYIYYTETSRGSDLGLIDEASGKIGEFRDTSYYLLYSPSGGVGKALDLPRLQSLHKTEKKSNLVIYCEKIWVHRDDIAAFQAETKRKVRTMLVPFNLK